MKQSSIFENRYRLGMRRRRRLIAERLEDRRLLATLTVNSASDNTTSGDGLVTLREAIIAANTNVASDLGETGSRGADTIAFDMAVFGAAQSIDLVLGELEVTDALTIDGPGHQLLTIDAQQNSRVLNIIGGPDFTLDGLTLTGGRTTGSNGSFYDTTHSGGGIRFASSGMLTLTGSVISGNSTTGNSTRGGGVFSNGPVMLDDSTVSLNSTDGARAIGGGIFSSSDVTVTRSTISDNSTRGSNGPGGGIFSSTHVTLNHSTVSGNSTQGRTSSGGGVNATYSVTLSDSVVADNNIKGDDSRGGGIYSGSAVTLTDSTVSGNSTYGRGPNRGNDSNGGGILALNTMTATGSIISGNSTHGDHASGGGIFSGSALTLNDSTVSGNSTHGDDADGGGIGVFRYGGTITLNGSTISGNRTVGSGSDGGGIFGMSYFGGSSLTIHNSIIAGNSVSIGSRGTDFLPDPEGVLTVQSSLIGDATDTGLTTPENGNQLNIDWKSVLENDGTDPTLTDNGGPTQSIAILPGGPAVDAGDNALTLSDNDQRGDGFPRTIDGDHDGAATVDLGAFEFQGTDFGDAPSAADTGFVNDYPVTLDQDGARHLVGALFLGASIDAEPEGLPDDQAGQDGTGGDDNNGEPDEDGVFGIASILASTTSATTSSFEVVVSKSGKLDAWIDFNQDGAWSEIERIFSSVVVTADAPNLLSFTVPTSAMPGDTGARFRVSSTGMLLPTGEARDGEVEDYIVTIDDGNTPEDVFVVLVDPAVTMRIDAGEIVLSTAQTDLFRAPLTQIAALDVAGFGEDNTLAIEIGTGFAGPGGGLTVDGAGGDNTLAIIGDGGIIDVRGLFSRFGTIALPTGASSVEVSIDSVAVAQLSPSGPLHVTGGPNSFVTLSDVADWRMSAPIQREGKLLAVANNADSGGNESIEADLQRPWQNFLLPSDVDNDGLLEAGDALKIINELARGLFHNRETGELVDPTAVVDWIGFYFDQNGDGKVSALDALRIVNELASVANPPTEQPQQPIPSLLSTSDWHAPGLTEQVAGGPELDTEAKGKQVTDIFTSPDSGSRPTPTTPVLIPAARDDDKTDLADRLLSDHDFVDQLHGYEADWPG